MPAFGQHRVNHLLLFWDPDVLVLQAIMEHSIAQHGGASLLQSHQGAQEPFRSM